MATGLLLTVLLTGLLLILLAGLLLKLLLDGLLLRLILSGARAGLLLRLREEGLLLRDLLGLTLWLLLGLRLGLILILLLMDCLALTLWLLDLLGLLSAAGSLFSSLPDFDPAMPLLQSSPFSLRFSVDDLASFPLGFSIVSPIVGQLAVVSLSTSRGGRFSTDIEETFNFRTWRCLLSSSSSELLQLILSVSESPSDTLLDLRLDFLSCLLRLFSLLLSLFLFPCLYLSRLEYFFLLRRLSSLELLISDDDEKESESVSDSEFSESVSDELSDSDE